MKFVPISETDVLFSAWETRVRDFEAFVEATGYDATGGAWTLESDGWKQRGGSWKAPGFDQTGDHPVVCVSWEDARAFCKWLTDEDRKAGRIGPGQEYRLPTDHEWSCAVGIGDQENPRQTPEEKNVKIRDVYPWGTSWPPPEGAGNYAGAEAKTKDWPSDWGTISGYDGGYPRTSPVGNFASNRLGIYDIGGNVWEWCEDKYKTSEARRVLRGASWALAVPSFCCRPTASTTIPGFAAVTAGFGVYWWWSLRARLGGFWRLPSRVLALVFLFLERRAQRAEIFFRKWALPANGMFRGHLHESGNPHPPSWGRKSGTIAKR